MRDIKYKAWDKIDKKIYKVSMIDTTSMLGYDTVYFIGHTSNNNGYRMHTEIELMEYTGEKDFKRTEEYPEGQEIYEGYILLIGNSIEGLVRYKDGCFKIVTYDYEYYFEDISNYVVAGNEFEDKDTFPELLACINEKDSSHN